MKKSYIYFSKLNCSLKNSIILSVILLGSIFTTSKAQSTFVMASNSQVNYTINSLENTITASPAVKSLFAQGDFVLYNGDLEEIKSFNLKMPLSIELAAALGKDSLAFQLKKMMVLPTLKLVHILGTLEVGGASRITELDFKYVINEDQSISLVGTKSIKLLEYHKNVDTLKNNDELKLNLNLTLHHQTNQMVAAVVN